MERVEFFQFLIFIKDLKVESKRENIILRKGKLDC